jgi:hypothetical protein
LPYSPSPFGFSQKIISEKDFPYMGRILPGRNSEIVGDKIHPKQFWEFISLYEINASPFQMDLY